MRLKLGCSAFLMHLCSIIKFITYVSINMASAEHITLAQSVDVVVGGWTLREQDVGVPSLL